MVKLNELFNIEYGNQADLNKLERASSADGIRFISRSSENLGFQCYVKKDGKLKVYNKGLITVTLGGTYVLSSFVQPDNFYTGQNIKVLTPKVEMSEAQKYFYCYAIASNRFRYISHGREANKTIDNILVPNIDEIPDWIYEELNIKEPSKKPLHEKQISFNDREWKYFDLIDYFKMYAGKYYPSDSYSSGSTPLVTSGNNNNGVKDFTNIPPAFNTVCLTIGKISASTFVQDMPFVASSDVTILIPKDKSKFNVAIGLFIATVINQEAYKWSYGRQIRLEDSKKLSVKLPSDRNGNPDWQFMEYYIKSLPYSSNLEKMFKKDKGLTDQELIEKYDTGKKVNFDKALKQMGKSLNTPLKEKK